MRFGWLLVSLIAAFGSGPGCSTPDRFECGVVLREGVARFCGGAGEVCVCRTHRCARPVSGDCGDGLRYVDGAGECVEPIDVSSQHASGGPGDFCPVVPAAQLDQRTRLGEGQDPRYVALGTDQVLVDWVDRHDEGVIQPGGMARIFLQTYTWDAQEVSPSFPIDTDRTAVPGHVARNAVSYAACAQGAAGGPTFALFGHWKETSSDTNEPVFLLARHGATATELLVNDETMPILGGTAPTSVRSFRIVGDGTGCWVVWVENTDGSTGAAYVRRITGWGSYGDAPISLNIAETSSEPQVRFRAVGEFASTTNAMTFEPLVASDGQGGIFVAMGARNMSNGHLVVYGQHVDETRAPRWPEGSTVVATLDTADYAGFEQPFRNAVAVLGNHALFALAAVATGGGARSLEYFRLNLAARATGEHVVVAPSTRAVRGPTLAALAPDRFLGAFAEWDGNLVGGLGALWYFQGSLGASAAEDITGSDSMFQESAVPTIVADPASWAPDSRLFVQRAAMVEGNLRLLLKRESIDLIMSPGWPEGGLDYVPADHELEGDLGTPPPPLPAPDDGGAMVGWTQGGPGRSAWLGRIRGAD